MVNNLAELFFNTVKNYGMKKLHFSFTYNKLYNMSNSFLYNLKYKYNIRPRERIAFNIDKSIYIAPFLFACWRNNNILIPLNPHYSKYQIEFTRPSIIFNEFNHLDFTSHSYLDDSENNSFDSNEIALILFTSGSSNNPKGVVLTHHNIITNLNQINNRIFYSDKDSTYSLLPWYHCYGLIVELLSMIKVGGYIHLPETNQFVENFKRISYYNPTILPIVPKILYTLEKNSSRFVFLPSMLKRKYLFGTNIRFITIGGAKCNSHSLDFFNTHFNIPICQGYGLTEMSPMVSLLSINEKSNSVGKLLNNIDLSFDKQSGEILLKGPNLMNGYLNKVLSSTSLEIDSSCFQNGWYKTGDFGYLDNDSYLWIDGRLNDIYKLSNGKFVNPIFIETIIEQNVKEINQCFIYTKDSIYNDSLIHCHNHHINQISISFIFNKLKNLFTFYEIDSSFFPKNIKLIKDPFSIENDCLSIKMEKKRKNIFKLYNL